MAGKMDMSKYSGKVLFDENSRVFRLYGKEMMYSFRADEGGNLEHLYWGAAVPPTDDLRYLSFSNVQLCFDPGPSLVFEDMTAIEDLVQEDVEPEDLLKEWDQARKQNLGHNDVVESLGDGVEALNMFPIDEEAMAAARRENAAWRLMKMQEMKMKRLEDGQEPGVTDEELAELAELAVKGNGGIQGVGTGAMGSHGMGGMTRVQSVGEFGGDRGGVHPTLMKAANFAEGFVGTIDVNEDEGFMPRSRTISMASVPVGLPTEDDWADALPRVGRNTKLLEWADLGTGDYRPPSFSVSYEDGGQISPLTYKTHTIVSGKLPMSFAKGKLPELRGGVPGEGASNTLVVTMEDKLTGLEFDLIYSVFRDHNALTRRVIVKNPKDKKVEIPKYQSKANLTTRLNRLMSCTVDFHTMGGSNLITLSGSWANERHMKTQQLVQGKFVTESLRGTSSHQHNPFCALATSREDMLETSGDVWALSLVYSGNFMMEAEVAETGRTRINMGINPHTFKWHLPPGDAFESPECVLVWSGNGLEQMSHTYHDLYRQFLIPERWFATVPPVLLNTWEAMYFDVSHAKVLELARVAANVGVEMIVLDDGWFGEREDATSSLGDWYEDRKKFPDGLPGIVKEINAMGLKFGIWVEPEMVNVKSQLYKKHPAWCLNQHGRNFRCEGRNQLVLDFGRPEVQQHVMNQLSTMLSGANIEYLKWDMNRHLTEVYGNSVAADKQGEVFHRYMVGVYRVMAMLNEQFPHLRIENCSGGAFRPRDAVLLAADLGLDNTDVFSRMRIQHGTSLAYPVSTIGSHITTVPNHQTNRFATMKTRFLIALFGTFGFELDIRRFTKEEIAEVKEYCQAYKELAPLVISGHFHRLWTPNRAHERYAYAWMCTSTNPTESMAAVVAVFLTQNELGRHLPYLQLRGLDPNEMYIVEEIFPNTLKRDLSNGQLVHGGGPPQYQFGRRAVQMQGCALMSAGLPVRCKFDGDSCAFVLHRASLFKRTASGRATLHSPASKSSNAPSSSKASPMLGAAKDGQPGQLPAAPISS
eukprot:CAMPEP_0206226650 /NCGR_PEP_ID=MMETSP0047_2-20121206/8208_1 /ASSEMBLY_ACC=CAM_ASM_000192 /TAXON_ID=195065 /ORGANISM="Chroomonas mesostigmatica_cf, Strain CCMP1168" /LENGTH=1037 /DNA_ID=CAMNT_0053649759 /DNA_START=69 /DNA_END=3183 /DNA_ORIENTATION=+